MVYADGQDLSYVLEDDTLDLTATSGAPIVNSTGEVLGINLATSRFLFWALGHANPVGRFSPALRSALNP